VRGGMQPRRGLDVDRAQRAGMAVGGQVDHGWTLVTSAGPGGECLR
jgi:hypothetical protein